MQRHVCNYVFQPCANVRNSACSGPSTQIWRARARRAFKRTMYTSLSTVIVRSVLYESAYCVEVRSYARLHNSLWLPDMSGNTRRPQLSLYARERIRHLLSGGLNSSQVVEALKKEGIDTSRQTVWRLDRHIHTHGTIMPLPKSGRLTKLTDALIKDYHARLPFSISGNVLCSSYRY
jgi:hypothetical protein